MVFRKVFFLVAVFMMIVSYAYGGNGLVLYLPFNGDAMDASGNGNNGVIVGNANWVAGKFDKAMLFDGATYIEVADKPNSGFDNVPGLTIELWIKIDEHHDNGIVVKLSNAGQYWPCSYNLETWSDQLIYFDIGADIGKYTTSNYPLGEWFHMAGVFDGKAKEDRLYVNGELKSTTARPETVVPDGDLPVYIGCVAPGQLFFKGTMDDLAIYSRALTQAEIMSDMNSLVTAVNNTGKISTTWADIKAQR
ncbi:TPA: LamG domain-containing protein [bacterium]|nr:LamG domain-containing protein [bacterium]